MPVNRRTLIFAAASAALALPLAGCAVRGVDVILVNKSGAITDIELRYTGGRVRVPALSIGMAHTTRVAPTGDSHLELDFTDAAGTRHREMVGVYFGPGFTGRVDITVEGAAGAVTWRDEIRV